MNAESKQRKMVRWGIIFMLIATPIGIAIDEILHLPTHKTSKSNKALSSFGEITMQNPQKYSDLASLYTSELGFQVLKPDGWEIHSAIQDIGPHGLEILKTKGFLDGIYLEKNHDKQFMITVFEVSSTDFSLDAFIDSQVNQMDVETNYDIKIKNVSTSNEWAIFAMSVPSFEKNYGEQILIYNEGRLFMLQYSGDEPKNQSLLNQSEFLSIIDSFEAI